MAQGYRAGDLGLLLFLGVLWGTGFMFISMGLESFSPLLFMALRFDISGLILLGVVLARWGRDAIPRGATQWAAVLIAGAFNAAGYHGFLGWGQQFTTASIAAVIVGLNPVATTVFSRALLPDDRVGRAGLAGLGLGFLGIVLLAALKPGDLLDARGLGELAVVAAMGSWALGSVLVKRSGHAMGLLPFVAWNSLVGAVLLHGLSFALEGGGRVVLDTPGVVSLLYLALVSSGLGFLIYFTLLERVGPIRGNLVSYVAPVFATLAGFLVLDNPLEARAFLAFALIAGGFALVARPGSEAPPGRTETPPNPIREP